MLGCGRSAAVRAVSMAAASTKVRRVVVVGASSLGSGIAQVCAQHDFHVTLVDRDVHDLQFAEHHIRKDLQRSAKIQLQGNPSAQRYLVNETMNKLEVSIELSKAASSADLVIEVVAEQLEPKRLALKQIEAAVSEKTLIVSSTSFLSLKNMASALRLPERFGGLHFFSPVPRMRLIEVVRGEATSDAVFAELRAFTRAIGKESVSVKDTPGFIVNRLLIPVFMEALRMHERGDASIKDIDTAMKLGAGFPMGLFQLADHIGLDTTKLVIDDWHSRFPDNPQFKPSPLLNRLVAENECGQKTGIGFFKYEKERKTSVNPRTEKCEED